MQVLAFERLPCQSAGNTRLGYVRTVVAQRDAAGAEADRFGRRPLALRNHRSKKREKPSNACHSDGGLGHVA